MDLLISLVSGGNGLLVALGAILATAIAAFVKGRSVERSKQEAKDSDALQTHYKDVADAASARAGITPDSVRDHDTYRRD